MLICLVHMVLLASAQTNATTDSLLALLQKPQPDSVLIKLNNELGFTFQYNSPAKSIAYFDKVVALAQKNQLALKAANGYYDLGFCYMLLASYDNSLQNYLQAARIYDSLSDKRRLFNTYMSVGNLYFNNNNHNKANEYYQISLQLARQKKDSLMEANVFTAMGNLFDKTKAYDSALYYLNKAHSIFEIKGDVYDRVNILSNLGLTYKHTHRNEEAIAHLEKVKKIVDDQQMEIDLVAQVYNNLGATYAQAKQYPRAKAAFDSSILYATRAGMPQVLMENYRNMSDMYREMGQANQEAKYLRQYYELKDSLFTTDKKNQLTQLEADYQLEKKNSELIKKDAEVVRKNSQRNVLLVIVSGAALLLAGLGFFYSRIKKQNRQLSQQNNIIQTQNEELRTLNNVKDRLFSIISHDLRNPLVTLQSYLTLSNNEQLPAEKKTQLRQQTINAVAQTGNMLDNLLAWANMQIRNTQAQISMVDVDDLVAETRGGAQPQAAQKQIIIHQDLAITSIPGEYNILSIALRNLLTNAIKFSDAEGNIWINAQKKGDAFLLSVKDEGRGMTPAQMEDLKNQQQQTATGTAGEKGSGLGLYLVTELLQKINARLDIQSEQGKGSTFSIILPAQ